MFNRLKSIFRSRTPPKQLVRARFDAAQTTRDNWRHWSAADHLSADMEAAPEVRRAADFVTTPVDEDGIALAFEHFDLL